MEDIKVGDIVRPNTPTRRKQFGKGVVVSARQARKLPFTVIFPTENNSFINYDFKEDHITKVKATIEEIIQLAETVDMYNELVEDLHI